MTGGTITEEQQRRAEANRLAAQAKLAARRAAAQAGAAQPSQTILQACSSSGSPYTCPATASGTACSSNVEFDLAAASQQLQRNSDGRQHTALAPAAGSSSARANPQQPQENAIVAAGHPPQPLFSKPDHNCRHSIHLFSAPTAGGAAASLYGKFITYVDKLGTERALYELVELSERDATVFQLLEALELCPQGCRVRVVSSADLHAMLDRFKSTTGSFGERLQRAMTSHQVQLQLGVSQASSSEPGTRYLQRVLEKCSSQRLSRVEQLHGGARTVEELLASGGPPQPSPHEAILALPGPSQPPPSQSPSLRPAPAASQAASQRPQQAGPSLSGPQWDGGEEELRAVAPDARKKRREEAAAERGREAEKKRKQEQAQAAEPELSDEQKFVIDQILAGRNVFVTGSAGTGKSFLLRKAVEVLRRERGMHQSLAITAPTGIAATLLGGCTIHAWAGVGLGKEPADQLVSRIENSRRSLMRWERTQALVVDEVSMLDGDLFEKLDYIGRRLRRHGAGRPLGGIQLVLVGDFLQLPPVTPGGEVKKFAFETEAWAKAGMVNIELKRVFRQRDLDFVSILNEVRFGNPSQETLRRLAACRDNALASDDGIETTRLFCRKANVEQENTGRLAALQEQSHRFVATDSGSEPYRSQLINNCPAPSELILKNGAQVMLLHNLDMSRGLVNGSRGVVKEIKPISGHMTPHVYFKASDTTLPIDRHTWTVEIDGAVMAQRTQVPLMLAWSMTIHKSQGMTIDSLEISLRGVFEYGQAYVALSRATALSALRLLDFDPRCVRAHPKVLQFYAAFASAGPACPALPAPPPPPAAPAPLSRPARPSLPPPAAPAARYDPDVGPAEEDRRAIPAPWRGAPHAARRSTPPPLALPPAPLAARPPSPAPAGRRTPPVAGRGRPPSPQAGVGPRAASPRGEGRATPPATPPPEPAAGLRGSSPTGQFAYGLPWQEERPARVSPPINFRRGKPPQRPAPAPTPTPAPVAPPKGKENQAPKTMAFSSLVPKGMADRPALPRGLLLGRAPPPAAPPIAAPPKPGSFYDV